MPTNLPPEYFSAEKRYKTATETRDKIEALEDMLSTIPKHKGTDKLRADYRQRLSKLKVAAQTKKGAGKYQSAYNIDREGAGQLVIVGPSNTGKSALVAKQTNASPESSPAPFTTWGPTAGMMPIENVQVQLIDTPSTDRDFLEPELFEMVKRSDMLLIMLDLLTNPDQQLKETIETLASFRVAPLQHEGRYEPVPRIFYKPILVLANKCDDADCEEVYEVFQELLEEEWPLLPVSVKSGANIDLLKQTLFEELEIVRVYSKAPGKEADLNSPFVVQRGCTVEEFAGKVHKDFLTQLKSAKVWGSTAFDGQMVQRDFPLQDGDIVELKK